MRLGILRKPIGTLMLVGLLPLVVSLVVILAGGAAIRFRVIRDLYEDTATMCRRPHSNALLHEELERLAMIARLPRLDAYVQEHGLPPPTTAPCPNPPPPIRPWTPMVRPARDRPRRRRHPEQ